MATLLAACLVAGATAAARASAPQQPEQGALVVTVEMLGADGEPSRLPGVPVMIVCPPGGAAPARDIVTDDVGVARADGVPPGPCVVRAALAGFRTAEATVRSVTSREVPVVLRLEVDQIRESVTVTAPGGADPVAAATTTLDRRMFDRAPLASDRIQDALPLVPGVVRGPDGLLNINGSRASQTRVTVDRSGGSDPVTGEPAIEIPVDVVETLDVQPTAYAVELGQSAGAVAAIATRSGGDTWRTSVNNFMPRIRVRGGEVRGFESFTPRVTIGGPLIADRLHVLGAAQYVLNRTRVESLPSSESDTEQEGVDGFARVDWKGQARRLTAVSVLSTREHRYVGLDTFNPRAVTPTLDTDSLLAGLGGQFFGGGGVLDLHLSYKGFGAGVAPSAGGDVMVLAPDVNQGAFFNSQDRDSHRVEAFGTYAFTPRGIPDHLWKVGVSATRESFSGVSTSRPVQLVDAALTPLVEIVFGGPVSLAQTRTLTSVFAQDTWRAGDAVTVQYGARVDHDTVVSDLRLLPRVSVEWRLPGNRTRLRPRARRFAAPPPLNVLAFDDMEDRVVRDLQTGDRTLVENRLAADLQMMLSTMWHVQVEHEWRSGLLAQVGYRRREGRDEPTLYPGASAIWLRTDGRTRYDEGQAMVRWAFAPRDQVMVSYTRSRSRGDVNAASAYIGNVRTVIVPDNAWAPLPTDVPNRLLMWGSVGLPHDFDVFPVLEIRDGFPYSFTDARREIVGARNQAGRYPRFLSFDVQVTRPVRLFGRAVTLGLKVFNITDHFNPRDVFANIEALRFGDFSNGVGRTFRAKLVVDF